jgi:hypothetical protein
MSEQQGTWLDDLITMTLAGFAPGVSQLHKEFTTPSGRTFRYELSEYPIPVVSSSGSS